MLTNRTRQADINCCVRYCTVVFDKGLVFSLKTTFAKNLRFGPSFLRELTFAKSYDPVYNALASALRRINFHLNPPPIYLLGASKRISKVLSIYLSIGLSP